MGADETIKQGRMTHADSALQVCMWVQGCEADIGASTQNKTLRNLLPTKMFNYLVFRNV